MSDEVDATQEIPVDRDGRRRVTPPVGAALSVLWWPDVERGSSR